MSPENNLSISSDSIRDTSYNYADEGNSQASLNGIQKNFKCAKCDKKYARDKSLRRHFKWAHLGIRVDCELCGKHFYCKSDLQIHMQSAHSSGDKKMFDCSKCEKKYAYRKSLNLHYRFAHTGMRFYCEFCGNHFARKSYLKSHTLKNHLESVYSGIELKEIEIDVQKWFNCSKCEKKYIKLDSLKRHCRYAHLGVRFHCELCEMDFNLEVKLKNHLESVHSEIELREIENDGEKWFNCSECEKKYTKLDSLKRHCRSAHLGVRFYCELCGNHFTRKSYLRSHTRICHGDGIPKIYECLKCEKTYADRGTFNRHYRQVHLGVRFYCDLCGNDFTRKNNLRSHMLSSHGFGMPKCFDCLECGKKYTEQKSLNRHCRYAHLGSRFYCELCGNDFARKHHLKSHMESAHGSGMSEIYDSSKSENAYSEEENVNPLGRLVEKFYCESCAESFIDKVNLMIHIHSVHLEIKIGDQNSSFDRNNLD